MTDNIQFVHEFLINKETGGVPWYNKKDFWIFCNSDFLTLQQRSSTARDIHGKEVLDKDKNPVTIEKIPEYLAVLDAGLNENPPKDHKLKPWWAGDHTSLNGYYFDDHGGNYCNEKGSLGVTAAINLLGDGLDNNADTAGIVICPFAFNKADSPNSYAEANKMLEVGKNLAKVVPKSATLVHEIFHAVRGDEFLSGAEERCKFIFIPIPCLQSRKMRHPIKKAHWLTRLDTSIDDLAACVDLGNTRPGEAIKNIENYVFFINHMYQLFGKSSDGILKNWDFAAVDLGPKSDDKKDLLFGARVPGPEDTIPDDPMDIDKK